nr:hypothetical protein [Streptomyces sp. SAJ15]
MADAAADTPTATPAAPETPAAAAVETAREAAGSAATRDTLARFFARDGAVSRKAAAPRIEGATVPVYTLSARFVAARPRSGAWTGTPIATLDFLASKAVAADGRKASVWTARTGGTWRVVNIATGDDETRYAALGARRLAGGTVFREPQIDAWYVQRGTRVLPLDPDATRAIGARGTTVSAYQKRVHESYGDKLPGSAYARKGMAGGYEPAQASATGGSSDGLLTVTSTIAGVGALVALGLCAAAALRTRRSG